jgi:DNA-binding CsgD family transcriptional regulator
MNQDELLSLIDQIYQAGADASLWPAVLQTVADAFGAGEASLSAVSPRSVPWLVAPRTDPEYLRSYGEHYHPLNLFWQRMTRAPVGTAVTDRMVLPAATLQSSQFYNEWSLPQGYSSVMGATLLAEGDWRIEFVVPGRVDFGPEHLKLYDAIAPHLRRAVQLNRRLQAAEVDRAYSLAALDKLGQGVVIVDCNARIIFANRAADSAFAGGLRLVNGVLCSDSAAETAALHSAIASGVGDRLAGSSDTVTVSRGSLRLPLSLLVIPLQSEINWTAGHQRAAAVFITDPERVSAPDARQLQKQFGLTRAEAVLVREMLKGRGVQDVADRLEIKIATARTHLHRVLAKTGARSQADLMRLMLTSGHWIRRDPEE